HKNKRHLTIGRHRDQCRVRGTDNGIGLYLNCAEGWEYYGGKCFYFSPDKLTWAQSRDECITRGGHLVIIGSLEDMEPEDKFWIGLTDSINENEWLWVDNSALSTRFWLGNQEPDDRIGEYGEYPEGEDCARMGELGGTKDAKSWLDANCNSIVTVCVSHAGGWQRRQSRA
uniref:Immune-related, lectin-like receptor 4 n=1 Tax=Hucho hucho TaxID=62062 RepID=A0A4W5KSR6_9TELE